MSIGREQISDDRRQKKSASSFPFFADLVVIARSLYPIPSRTRPSKSSAPMVLSLKAWKSRSPPGLPAMWSTFVSRRARSERAAARRGLGVRGTFVLLLGLIVGYALFAVAGF